MNVCTVTMPTPQIAIVGFRLHHQGPNHLHGLEMILSPISTVGAVCVIDLFFTLKVEEGLFPS